MQYLRPPDERLSGLLRFASAPHDAEVDHDHGGRLRVHSIDEGPADGEPVLLLHEPSWSYLHRTT